MVKAESSPIPRIKYRGKCAQNTGSPLYRSAGVESSIEEGPPELSNTYWEFPNKLMEVRSLTLSIIQHPRQIYYIMHEYSSRANRVSRSYAVTRCVPGYHRKSRECKYGGGRSVS